ncbi:MAG: FAD binding domain-containing protein, partial [Dethiobacter sp.]|nr:FAD binding domain-containing protein [Dethiobacter sp.]
MKNFCLLTPETLDHAFNMLAEHAGARTLVLAGGTDLIPNIRADLLAPDYLVDLTGLGFDQISASDDRIIIGSTATFKQICSADPVCKYLPALADAARSVGAVQTRAIATMGGNVCSAVPSLDSAPVLMIYEAEVRLASSGGERFVPIAEFFLAPRKSARQEGEILTAFIFRKPASEFKAKFIKFGRRNAVSLSIVNVAFGAEIRGGKITGARGAVGACAPTPVRLAAAEEYLNGKDLH